MRSKIYESIICAPEFIVLAVQLPPIFLQSLNGTSGFDKEAFEKVHASGEQVTSIRINPGKRFQIESLSLSGPNSKIPWTEFGYYLSTRPSFTFDPLFHAGCYYVQEASSMFLEQALKQTVDLTQPIKILDLCAAPGGKSTHIQSLISRDSLLVSNEAIRSRANVLKDNIIKWGCENLVVTNNDPSHFSGLKNYFDVIVVDAPCSGSGLFRRDPEAISEWSLHNVQLCSQRQQRILADIWPALKRNGILIYSTCSYSKEEDEEISKWMMDSFSAEICSLKMNDPTLPAMPEAGKPDRQAPVDSGIVHSNWGYRFWPDKVKGEGFFLASFRKKDGETDSSLRTKRKPEQVSKKEMSIIEKWVKKDLLSFIRHNTTVYAWPEKHMADFSFLLEQLRVIYSGTMVGDLTRDKLVPSHPLAMSNLASDNILRIELDRERSIQYLQRKDLKPEFEKKGWQLVTFGGHPLGWVNVLPNRVNNYYPKELRILKDN